MMPELDIEVRGEPAHYVAFDLNGTGKVLVNYQVTLFGWAIRNVSSTTEATADIYDGTDTSGTVVIPANLAGNEVSVVWLGPNGVRFRNGLYLNVTAQEIKGCLFYRRHHGD